MTDTERTEREIIEELKKRFREPMFCEWDVVGKGRRFPYAKVCVSNCQRPGKPWVCVAEAVDDEALLAAVRSLPLPAEQESSDPSGNALIGEVLHQARIACHAGLREFAQQIEMLPSRLSDIQRTGVATDAEWNNIVTNLKINREQYTHYVLTDLVRRSTLAELAEIAERMHACLDVHWNSNLEMHRKFAAFRVEHPELFKGKEAGDAQ